MNNIELSESERIIKVTRRSDWESSVPHLGALEWGFPETYAKLRRMSNMQKTYFLKWKDIDY